MKDPWMPCAGGCGEYVRGKTHCSDCEPPGRLRTMTTKPPKRAVKGTIDKRRIISFSDELDAAMVRAARKAGLSVSEWLRRAAEAALAKPKTLGEFLRSNHASDCDCMSCRPWTS